MFLRSEFAILSPPSIKSPMIVQVGKHCVGQCAGSVGHWFLTPAVLEVCQLDMIVDMTCDMVANLTVGMVNMIVGMYMVVSLVVGMINMMLDMYFVTRVVNMVVMAVNVVVDMLGMIINVVVCMLDMMINVVVCMLDMIFLCRFVTSKDPSFNLVQVHQPRFHVAR